MTSMTSVIYQGDKITLTCYVMRSKPEPEFYVWYKDQTAIGQEQTHVVEQIMPEDRGYYTCRATNTVGEGQSQPFEIDVKCKFHSSFYCIYVRGLKSVYQHRKVNVISYFQIAQ